MTEERFGVVDGVTGELIAQSDFYLTVYSEKTKKRNSQGHYELGIAIWHGSKILLVTDNLKTVPETLLKCSSHVFIHDLSTDDMFKAAIAHVTSFVQQHGLKKG